MCVKLLHHLLVEICGEGHMVTREQVEAKIENVAEWLGGERMKARKDGERKNNKIHERRVSDMCLVFHERK